MSPTPEARRVLVTREEVLEYAKHKLAGGQRMVRAEFVKAFLAEARPVILPGATEQGARNAISKHVGMLIERGELRAEGGKMHYRSRARGVSDRSGTGRSVKAKHGCVLFLPLSADDDEVDALFDSMLAGNAGSKRGKRA